MSNSGHSTYHAATVQFQKRYSQGLVLDAFYTFSKAIDQCDNDYGTCSGVAPVTNRALSKGRAGYDQTHRLVASAIYEIPVGKGRHFMNKGGIMDWFIGGYELSWIQTVETGNPFSVFFTNSPNNYFETVASATGTLVPNVVSTPTMPGFGLGKLIGGNRFNQALSNAVLPASDFAAPAPFTVGNAGRNIVTGPASYYSQFSAKKNFKLTERFNLQLRFDFQNPFHNYAFSAPSNTLDFKNPNLFGKITSDVATASLNGEPLMNLMLKLSW
jgi:hypothetical protein